MPRVTRWLVAVAALIVLGVFAFPLWRITLEAPQYPEGIGMLIHVDGVTGVKEHDLENINGLNHYIGMARIEPDAIPELKFMPWIAGAIALTGLLVAWRASRGVYIAWSTVVIGILGFGVYDFWEWEYDYGHNLNPDAAIRIPGLTYQPPLFGSKQILNFVANSYPAAGGLMLIAAGVIIGCVWLYLVVGQRAASSSTRSTIGVLPSAVTVASAAVLLMSCAGSGPRPLVAGTDECAQCRMMISDPRFGAEVVTRTGKVHTFDAVECLAAYVAAADPAHLQSVWVNDYEHAGTWIAASEAVFISGANIGSPMGRSLLALAPGTVPASAVARYGGRATDWRSLTSEADATGSAHAGGAAAHGN